MQPWADDAFAGKQVLVVGGTSGIGAAIARGFAGLGAVVTATGATAAEVAAAEPSGSAATCLVLDVTDPPTVDEAVTALGDLDIVVNCAGVIRRGDEHDPAVFASVIDVNLNGTMRVCAAARPGLARTRGCVVNTASMLTFFGGGHAPAYSASKGGIGQLTKSLAIAWAADGIRVNAIAPGWIATPLTKPLRDDPVRSAAVLSRTPMARFGEPEDVTGAVLFLCSAAAAFVTGVVLPVDGGYLIA